MYNNKLIMFQSEVMGEKFRECNASTEAFGHLA
jgi:hypothetical protein